MLASSASLSRYPYPAVPVSGHRTRLRLHARAQTQSGSSSAERDVQSAMLPQFTRRFTIGLVSSIGLAAGANFGGLTSLLLGLNPEAARNARLDILYPVRGFFRCWETEKGFEFIYPQDWVGDQKVLYRAVEKAEQARSLDLPALSKSQNKVVTEPVVAFGPPGTSGELNVSVVLAPVLPGFLMDKLGDAREAGNLILRKFIAPPGSNKQAILIDAYKRAANYYTLEYTVQGPGFFRHHIAVYTTARGQLYSLNAQSPENEWTKHREKCIAVAKSFKVLV